MNARRVLLLVLLGGVLVLWGCASREAEPSPEASFETAAVETPLGPLATPIPLEPLKELRGKGLREAPIERAVAVWTGSVLKVVVAGQLPTPCHRLRAGMKPNSPPGTVELLLYVQPPSEDQACAQQVVPYEVELAVQPATLPVRVLVNGKAAFINR